MNRFLLATLAAAVAGCTSPESTRTQGGGPGADTGNAAATIAVGGYGAQPSYPDRRRLDDMFQRLQSANRADVQHGLPIVRAI